MERILTPAEKNETNVRKSGPSISFEWEMGQAGGGVDAVFKGGYSRALKKEKSGKPSTGWYLLSHETAKEGRKKLKPKETPKGNVMKGGGGKIILKITFERIGKGKVKY